jgi:hypothetical protein
MIEKSFTENPRGFTAPRFAVEPLRRERPREEISGDENVVSRIVLLSSVEVAIGM